MTLRSFALALWLTFCVAPAWAGEGAAGRAPLVGVTGSQALRWTPAPKGWRARLLAPPASAPVSFDAQIADWRLRAFHFTVYDDPAPGLYARGETRDVPALRQPGLKVVDPARPAADALCATLMTCLVALEAWSASHPGHDPILVALDLRPGPPRGRFARLAGGPEPPHAPRWEDLAKEIAHVLPASRRAAALSDARGRLLIVARGGRGARPPQPPFLIAADEGAGPMMLDARGSPLWRLERAAAAGRLAIVIGAPWESGADPWVIGAREAAAAGAAVVIAEQDALRGGGAR